MSVRTLTLSATALAVAAALAGCNDSGSSSNSDLEPITSSGEITRFGSVYVNGTRFETRGAEIRVDDIAADEQALDVGMVVTVEGEVDPATGEGRATAIRFDADLEGPVTDVSLTSTDGVTEGTIAVLGHTVEVTADTRFEGEGSITSLNQLTTNTRVEVSGWGDGEGTLTATRIEVDDDDDDIEVRGTISDLNTVDEEFTLNGRITVDYSNAELDDDLELANGLFVEVEASEFDTGSNTLIATEVEEEERGDGRDDDRERTFAGLVRDVSGLEEDPAWFRLNHRRIYLDLEEDDDDDYVDPSTLTAGTTGNTASRVKVEGRYRTVDGERRFYAEEIERLGRDDDDEELEIEGYPITAIDLEAQPPTIEVNGLTLMITPNTELDGDGIRRLSDLAVGMNVEVEYYENADGQNIATEIEVEDEDGDDD
ncbi:hypothetical protein SAMN05660831_01496 [Thiohalospira halophila DSM 15071]|uniref:DUF5666 domain-containing protein n=1 Tax=Thiohalospira halophila DSM 15071 TaxID=1123397 RepID=A0A1I1RL41_9GAMM|nr:DUF5666 domain-containing protein [Thiohalospira halophila]SFD35034.1 hypothetical protein SAMN05660831_01496 [Thiohalospira halophila DSM 15071]